MVFLNITSWGEFYISIVKGTCFWLTHFWNSLLYLNQEAEKRSSQISRKNKCCKWNKTWTDGWIYVRSLWTIVKASRDINCSEHAHSEMGWNYSIYCMWISQYSTEKNLYREESYTCMMFSWKKLKVLALPPKAHLSFTFPEKGSSLDYLSLWSSCLMAFALVESWEIIEHFGDTCLLKSQVISPHYFSCCQVSLNYCHQKMWEFFL